MPIEHTVMQKRSARSQEKLKYWDSWHRPFKVSFLLFIYVGAGEAYWHDPSLVKALPLSKKTSGVYFGTAEQFQSSFPLQIILKANRGKKLGNPRSNIVFIFYLGNKKNEVALLTKVPNCTEIFWLYVVIVQQIWPKILIFRTQNV